MSDATFDLLLLGPIILSVVGFILLRRWFGATKAATFLGGMGFLLIANIAVGLYGARTALEQHASTAAAITPVVIWLESYPIVILSFLVWLAALWLMRRRTMHRRPR